MKIEDLTVELSQDSAADIHGGILDVGASKIAITGEQPGRLAITVPHPFAKTAFSSFQNQPFTPHS